MSLHFLCRNGRHDLCRKYEQHCDCSCHRIENFYISSRYKDLVKQLDEDYKNKVNVKDKKKMNIYSFPLTKCSRTIWCGRDGKRERVIDMAIPHLKNVYAKLIRSGWQECVKYTYPPYPGYYASAGSNPDMNIRHMNKTLAFLREMCPTWNEIVRVMNLGDRNLCMLDGTPKHYSVTEKGVLETISFEIPPIYNELYNGEWSKPKAKLNNGKLFTDSDGKQYLLFPVE